VDEAVALIIRVECLAEARRCKVVADVLAVALAAVAGNDETELVVDQAGVGDVDGLAARLAKAAIVVHVDTDATVHGAVVICQRRLSTSMSRKEG
jgi:hypothetical protein